MKHFVLYNNNGVLSATTPKDWARAHRDLFPGHNFLDNLPTTNQIEVVLDHLGFTPIHDNEVMIYYDLIAIG